MNHAANQIAKMRGYISEQRKWIDEHGRSRAGYILRYGSAQDPDHLGDGGEAIYAADVAELERLEESLRRIEKLA